jgi:HEAT repeat protein
VIRIAAVVTLALAAAGGIMVVTLVVRRLLLARELRRHEAAAARLRPVALAIVDGEPPEAEPEPGDAIVLAELLRRYGRRLTGDSRERIGAYLETTGSVDEALDELRSRRSWRRAAAAFALGDMGSQRAAGPLLAALGDPERDVRAAAARSLGRLGVVDAVEPLVAALADVTVPRVVAAQALVAIGEAAAPRLAPLLDADDAAIRRAALDVLGLVGSAADAALVVRSLRDPSAEVRSGAARALGRLGGRAGSAELQRALDDRVAFVRASAANALCRVGDRSASPALVELARSDEYAPARAAAYALAALDPAFLAAEAERAGASQYLLEAADVAAL